MTHKRDTTYMERSSWWEARVKHGEYSGGRESRTHYIWRSMLSRCYLVSNKDYPRYGGRGIDVCPGWHYYDNFLAYMGDAPNGHSLDRIDNEKGYWPDNCRWATASKQQRNKRNTKRYVRESDGFTGVLVECAQLLGVSKALAHWRFKTWGTFKKGEKWQLQKVG